MHGHELGSPQSPCKDRSICELWAEFLSHLEEGAHAVLQLHCPHRCDINYDALSHPVINNPHLHAGRSISMMASSVTCLALGQGWLKDRVSLDCQQELSTCGPSRLEVLGLRDDCSWWTTWKVYGSLRHSHRSHVASPPLWWKQSQAYPNSSRGDPDPTCLERNIRKIVVMC